MIAPGPPATAMTGTGQTRIQDFAVCMGRLSAMMEYPSLVPDLSPEQIRTDRRDFADLLAASMPYPPDPDLGHQAMMWRVQARTAQSGLLRVAAYGADPRRARIAQATLRRQLLSCHSLLPR